MSFENVTVAMVLHCQFSWTLNDARNGATTNTLQKPTPASHMGQIHPLSTISGVFASFSTVLPKIVLAMAETHPCVSQGSNSEGFLHLCNRCGINSLRCQLVHQECWLLQPSDCSRFDVLSCCSYMICMLTGATLPLKVVVTRGVARIWCQGARRSRRRRSEHRGAEWGGVWGGVSALQPTRSLGGVS